MTSKGYKSPTRLVPRRNRAPQDQNTLQGLENWKNKGMSGGHAFIPTRSDFLLYLIPLKLKTCPGPHKTLMQYFQPIHKVILLQSADLLIYFILFQEIKQAVYDQLHANMKKYYKIKQVFQIMGRIVEVTGFFVFSHMKMMGQVRIKEAGARNRIKATVKIQRNPQLRILHMILNFNANQKEPNSIKKIFIYCITLKNTYTK